MRGDVRREPPPSAAESETLSMCGNSMRENRETLETPEPFTDSASVAGAGRSEKADGRTSDMHVSRESDGPIVPTKRANNAATVRCTVPAAAESVEGRGPTKGNAKRALHAPDAEPEKRGIGLCGVREAAQRDKTSVSRRAVDRQLPKVRAV